VTRNLVERRSTRTAEGGWPHMGRSEIRDLWGQRV